MLSTVPAVRAVLSEQTGRSGMSGMTSMSSMTPTPSAVTASVTVGVGTHRDVHVAAAVDQTGRLLGSASFAVSTRGYVALITWAERLGPVAKVGIEGTGTDGAGLSRFVRDYGLASGLAVVEVDRPDRSTRRRRGKSDPIDAGAAARATLAGTAATLPAPRPPWPAPRPPRPRPARAGSR